MPPDAVLGHHADQQSFAQTPIGDAKPCRRKGFADRIEDRTARKHQIRAQLAHVGLPIPGDRKYGSHRPFALGIALHSASLTLQHPVTAQTLHFTAPLPDTWPRWAREGEVPPEPSTLR